MEDNNSSSSVLPNAGEGGPPRLPPPRLATSPPLGRHAFGLVPVARVAHSAPVNDPVPVQPVPGGWPLPPQHGPEDPGARPAFDGAGGGGGTAAGSVRQDPATVSGLPVAMGRFVDSRGDVWVRAPYDPVAPPPAGVTWRGSIDDHERDGDFFGYEADALYTDSFYGPQSPPSPAGGAPLPPPPFFVRRSVSPLSVAGPGPLRLRRGRSR
eukprot:jgi/Mesvir1/10503/Mv14926-RA.1